jgi:hypothetical protein
MMYSLMDIVHLGFKVTPYRRLGANAPTLSTHLFEEPTVDSATLGKVNEFNEAR